MLTAALLAAGALAASIPLQAPPSGASPRPRPTQYFDPRRPGHGIDLSWLGTDATGTDQYLAIFYTYGDGGEPEWFLAQGPMRERRFEPIETLHGDTLSRYRFVAGAAPVAVPSAGRLRLDFVDAASQPACAGTGATAASGAAVMRWSLGSDRDQTWCLLPLVSTGARAALDLTGTWFGGGAEGGWGASILSYAGNLGDAQFGLLYYPDAAGAGRWAFWTSARAGRGIEYGLFERRGYCRSCQVPVAALSGSFNDAPAGRIVLDLVAASRDPAAGNRIAFDVAYQIPPGGTFSRRVTGFALLGQPAGD